MVLANYQFQYNIASQAPANELIFGAPGATVPAVDIVSISGLFDREMRDDDRESHLGGDMEAFMRVGPRYIRFELEVRGTPGDQDYYDLINLVRDVFSWQPGIAPSAGGTLTWQWPGEVEKFVRCRPVRYREGRESSTEYGLLPVTVELKCADPRIYSVVTKSQSSGPYVNDGNTFAYPVVEVTPTGAHNVSISQITAGFAFSGQFTEGSGNLVADFDRLIRVTNDLYVYRTLDNYPLWNHPRIPLRLDPGSNVITVTVGTLVNITWRDTWI